MTMRTTVFQMFFIISAWLFVSSTYAADPVILTDEEVEHFLQVSLFQPRLDHFIDNVLAQNQKKTKNFSKQQLDEVRSQWRKKIIGQYQELVRKTFNKEELKDLGDYFASPICEKWQVFSDTAYANGKSLMLDDLKNLKAVNSKKKRK